MSEYKKGLLGPVYLKDVSIDSEEQGIFTSHVLLPCQNSLSTLPRIQLDHWQFFERFDSCYAATNPSPQLLASSKEEEQSEDIS